MQNESSSPTLDSQIEATIQTTMASLRPVLLAAARISPQQFLLAQRLVDSCHDNIRINVPHDLHREKRAVAS